MELHQLFIRDFVSPFVEIFLSLSIFYLLVYGVLINAAKRFGYVIVTQNIAALSIYCLFCASLLVYNQRFDAQTYVQGMATNDRFISSIRIVTLLSSSCVLFISLDYIQKDRVNLSEGITLILLSVLGTIILIGSNDLLTLYLSIEMQRLCFYVLATFKRNSRFSTESGLKYFVLGAFASGLLLFGCSLIYGFSGTTNFEELSRLFSYAQFDGSIFNGVAMGCIFVLLAFMFKLAAAPFHMWVPDVYEGSPTYITAYFSIVPKLTILGLCTKLSVVIFFGLSYTWKTLFIFCGLSSLILGCASALYQRKIKRLLSYRAIVHAGYLLLGISCNSLPGTESVIFYMVVYIFMSLAVFIIVLNTRNTSSNGRLLFLSEFINYSRTTPIVAFRLRIALFSMAGIPPLSGFLRKMNIFLNAIQSELYVVSVLGLLLSALRAVYYIRVIKIIYFDTGESIQWFSPINKISAFLLPIFLTPIVFLFVYPDMLNVFVSFSCYSLIN